MANTRYDPTLARPANEPGARDQRAISPERADDGLLARDFGLAVRLHALHQVAVERLAHVRGLVRPRCAVVDVDVSGRHERVSRSPWLQRRARQSHLSWVPRHVGDEIPALVLHGVIRVRLPSVGLDEPRTVGRVAGLASRQARDVVPGRQRRSSYLAAKPGGPAENKDAHPAMTVDAGSEGNGGSLSADRGWREKTNK